MDLFAFDDDYVRRLKEHDRETEAHFDNYFRSLLFVKLRRRLSSPQAIDDVTQEVFTRVLARLGELRDSRKLGAFVLAVCNHVLLEWYRSESRAEPLDDAHQAIPGRSNVEAELLSKETTERVRRVLSRMPERDAAILRTIFLEEEEKEEVCRRYDVDRQYLRVLLHRAKERFRSAFS